MEIQLVKTERALSPTQISLADYVINPYKGCLTGCLYCYARTSRQMARVQKTWGEFLFIKENFTGLLEQELKKAGQIRRVLIGSTTEPFQEEDGEMMPAILALLKAGNIPFVILTKSALVSRHLSLLTYSPHNKVYITYNTAAVRELFEKASSSQAARLEAAAELTCAGVDTILYISPVFPCLSEPEVILSSLKGKVKKVFWESYNPKMGNWEELKLRLEPALAAGIEAVYASENAYNTYWEEFEARVRLLNREYGFTLEFFIYPYNSYYMPG